MKVEWEGRVRKINFGIVLKSIFMTIKYPTVFEYSYKVVMVLVFHIFIPEFSLSDNDATVFSVQSPIIYVDNIFKQITEL